MAKNKASKKYDSYFEESLSESELVPEKFEGDEPALEPELIWFYCLKCRGNSKAWSHKKPLACVACGYVAPKKIAPKQNRSRAKK